MYFILLDMMITDPTTYTIVPTLTTVSKNHFNLLYIADILRQLIDAPNY